MRPSNTILRFSRQVGIVLALATLVGLSLSSMPPLQTRAEAWTDRIVPVGDDQNVEGSVALCRYGVGGTSNISAYPVGNLGLGWYIDWGTTLNSSVPPGVEYMPMIRLKQASEDGYTYTPDAATVAAEAAEHPGRTWIVGNEPDRRDFQDDLEPHVYAHAYQELYHLIKNADPTAKVAAGGIVQPTPVRLLYLDMVLDSYRERYGVTMPVDVWNIHAFILPERSCDPDAYPENCWGAEIPPGIDWAEGEVFEIEDNDNIEVFKRFVQDFRAWMASRGYRDRPLIITEFGVQMWPEYGFPPERVNDYMDATFDFLRTATGPNGYPADGNRLVQRWAWYSLTDSTFNGWLFDPGDPPQRTVFGDNYAAYTAEIDPTANLFPVRIWTEPAGFSTGEPVTLTLAAKIANAGNIPASGSAVVRFYSGTPDGDHEQLGADQVVTGLDGCGEHVVVRTTMKDIDPGSHPVFVTVDATDQVVESVEGDNTLTGTALVATHRVFAPLVIRSR